MTFVILFYDFNTHLLIKIIIYRECLYYILLASLYEITVNKLIDWTLAQGLSLTAHNKDLTSS